jgi:hypothetical protein
MKLSLSEIINKACELKTKQEKIEWLRKHDTTPLRIVLKYTYDKNVEFLIPNTPPPWKKNSYIGVEGMLFKEARRLRIFVKGGGYDTLNQMKRETLFIRLLEDIDNNDADLLCKMIQQKPLKGLSLKQVEAAFPDLIEKVEEKEDGQIV